VTRRQSPATSRASSISARRDYADVWAMQLALVEAAPARRDPDTLLFVEHPHVITAGRSAKRDNLIDVGDTPLFEIERGGDVTYHGPASWSATRSSCCASESAICTSTCATWRSDHPRAGGLRLPATRKPGWTGVWNAAAERKLASIGVAVKRWVTLHGFALNVAHRSRAVRRDQPVRLDAAVMGRWRASSGRPSR
jgi:lipoyl(octanoyl) transferase